MHRFWLSPVRLAVLLNLALLLAVMAMAQGCRSDTGRRDALERGTLVRPPPRSPTFQPSQDAPHATGQPGHVPGTRVAPQPGPRPSRILPQTPATKRVPGIWAGDGPRASMGRVPHPMLYGVELPLPDEATDEERKEATLCRDAILRAASSIGTDVTFEQLYGERLLCTVATLYNFCIGMRYLRAQKATDDDVSATAMLRSMSNEAWKMRDLACANVKDDPLFMLMSRTNRELGEGR